MMFAWLITVIIMLVLLALVLRKYTRLDFVAHVKVLWRAWSVRLSVVSVLLGTMAEQFPQQALNAWAMLPPDIKGMLSPDWLHYISTSLVILAVFAQVFRQPKMRGSDDVDHGSVGR